ncbi:MAG: hypothetical protein ACFFD7_02575 [Candidatus Thorarchaeota archaeon]
MNLKIFISHIDVLRSKHDQSVYYELIGELQSGLEVYINSYHYDLQAYIGRYVEMLLCVTRSPYLERGIKNHLFFPYEYYSIELVDELLEKGVISSEITKKDVLLTGEYIDSYNIPEEWVPHITSRFYRDLLKKSSALKTKDGIFLLSPIHLKKRVPIEKFPKQVTIATARIDLAAWRPYIH